MDRVAAEYKWSKVPKSKLGQSSVQEAMNKNKLKAALPKQILRRNEYIIDDFNRSGATQTIEMEIDDSFDKTIPTGRDQHPNRNNFVASPNDSIVYFSQDITHHHEETVHAALERSNARQKVKEKNLEGILRKCMNQT